MAAPNPPFATSAMVAAMIPSKVNLQSDFTNDDSMFPTKANVEQFLNWVSSQVEMQFSMAGYRIPLAIISGETWPTHQTTYLQLLATLGGAAMAGGHTTKPAPALAPSRGNSTGNIFQDMFNAELAKIHTLTPRGPGVSLIKFRANYYIGTLAENNVVEPKGPTTDFMEGKWDPYRQLSNWNIADKILDIQQSMTELNIPWDYLFTLFDINKGFGRSVHEPT